MRRAEREPTKGEQLWRAMPFEIRQSNDETRTMIHVITSRSVDRYGDVVEPRGGRLENFKKNPVVLFGHRDWNFPIGRNRGLEVSDIEVVATTEFAGLEQSHADAETAYRLARDGFLKAWSIGFMPITWSEDEALPGQDGWWFKEWELMEYSLVPIPANPDAIMSLSKAFALPDGATETDLLDALKAGPRQKYFDVAAALVKGESRLPPPADPFVAERAELRTMLERVEAATARIEAATTPKPAPRTYLPDPAEVRAAFRSFAVAGTSAAR